MAQEEGFEPPTNRLTADCSTTELLLNNKIFSMKKRRNLSYISGIKTDGVALSSREFKKCVKES
jgi:hypothetical protein